MKSAGFCVDMHNCTHLHTQKHVTHMYTHTLVHRPKCKEGIKSNNRQQRPIDFISSALFLKFGEFFAVHGC